MNDNTKTKKYSKFLTYTLKSLSYTEARVKKTVERLRAQGYKDIRKVFAGEHYIEGVDTKGCRVDAINVHYVFGTVEGSPVDAFSLAELDEILKYLARELKKTTQKLETLEEVST